MEGMEGRKCFLETGNLEEISRGAVLDLDFVWSLVGRPGLVEREGFEEDDFEVSEVFVRDRWADARVPKSISASSTCQKKEDIYYICAFL
jgi:hypothetical protein